MKEDWALALSKGVKRIDMKIEGKMPRQKERSRETKEGKE